MRKLNLLKLIKSCFNARTNFSLPFFSLTVGENPRLAVYEFDLFDLLTGALPASSRVVAEVTVLRFRNCLFAITGSCSSCIISSASMTGEVLSADCEKDMEAEARTGSTSSEAGFGACVFRFLGEGASSN